jgi:hypothetical protein
LSSGMLLPPIPTTPKSIPFPDVKGMWPQRDQFLTMPSSESGMSNTLHRSAFIQAQTQGSMGPPPSCPHRTNSQSTMDMNVTSLPSTATMTTSTLSLPSSSDPLVLYPQLGEMMAASSRQSYPSNGVPRKYQNREHIYAKTASIAHS